MEDLIGQTLGQYKVVALTGEGGMATVYRARQLRLERDVAVKVLLPALAADAGFRERFDREARASANLRHPNILTVHDYGETADGQLYLVVEYVEGGTLRERLERPLPLEEAVEIVAQVAEALDYAHQQGVVHRDVKPNNILLTSDGRPLLADFGLVKPIQSDRRLTATGIMLGTPDYVSPEQAQALEIDGRSDIYALGVMLFEMLTGQYPYTGDTPVSIIIKHVKEPMPRPSERNPAVPPALDHIVAKATAKSPDERYQRAGEMARALRAALVPGATPELGAERVTPPPPAPEPVSPLPTPGADMTPPALPRPWHQRRTVWAALALALVAALVVGALLILPSPSEDRETAVTGAVPTAQPGEVMILIAQFRAQEGSEHYDVSQRIYDKLSADVRQFGDTGVTVYQLPQVIESSAAALESGRQYGATTVIWGFYDDIGISPNIEAVGTIADSQSSVGLERFMLDAAEAASFKWYIAKDLPQELSFLTALRLVETFMLQGDLDRTMSFLGMAAANLPPDPQFRSAGDMVHFIQGMIAFFDADLEAAVQQMSQAIAINPDMTLYYTMRAFAYIQMEAVDLTMADLEQAIALGPGNTLAYTIKGALEWMMGDLEAAAQTFDRLIELEPKSGTGYAVRGMIGFEMGDLAASLAVWDQMEKIFPDFGYAAFSRGLVYEKMGQSQRAAADYAHALEMGIVPSLNISFTSTIAGEQVPPYSYLFECAVYQVQGEIEQALVSCDQALQLDPTYADALWKRGQLHVAQGDLEAGVEDYTAAIQVDPSWPWVYYLRAHALAKLGRADEAQADLIRALELEPVDELRRQIEALQADTAQ